MVRNLGKKGIYSFDIDGVVADTAGSAIKTFNKIFNQNKVVSDLKSFFIIYDWVFEILKKEELAQSQTVEIWNNPEGLFLAKPVNGAVGVIRKLYNVGAEVRFITSRPNSVRGITIDWFKKWLPWVLEDEIHISLQSEGLQRSFKKAEIIKIAPKVHFDDSIEHANDIAGRLPDTKVILVRQPWNLEIPPGLGKSIIIPDSATTMSNLEVLLVFMKHSYSVAQC